MTDTPDGGHGDGRKAPPELPKALVDLARPVIVGTALWAVALVVALLLQHAAGTDTGWWPATATAGFGLGLIGLSIMTWQRRASRRGSRGAQRGL